MLLIRQTLTLTNKNFKIIFGRRAVLNTVVWAFILPIALTILFSFMKNLIAPVAKYGIGEPVPILTLEEALATSTLKNTGRDKIVFVNSGFDGGDIDSVIDALSQSVNKAPGKTWEKIDDEARLREICPSSLRGVTACFGAVVFHSSPDEGPDGLWNYTIRLDGGLNAINIKVDKTDNDGQVYLLPLQRAVDFAISSLDNGDDNENASRMPDQMEAYAYTQLTDDEYKDRVLERYMSAVVNALAVLFVTSILFITYHLSGFVATEREIGMIRLIDAMMPVRRRWHAQAARIVSYHLCFSLTYLPGWIIGALTLKAGVYKHTNAGIVVIFQVLAGLSMASMSLFASSFFKKAQLSANWTILVTAVVGILCQSLTRPGTAPVVILSFLFPPATYVYFSTFMARWEQRKLGARLGEVAPDSPWDLPGGVLWIFLIIQIICFPLLGAVVESYLHGTATKGRTILREQGGSLHPEMADAAVSIRNLTKVYRPSALSRLMSPILKPREPVLAVNDLTLSAGRGQIVVLLGANGSGKSTTLDAIAGMNKLTSGSITIDGTGGLGISPQKNVFWNDLTVEQHIRIFNSLKAPGKKTSKAEIRDLIRTVDLDRKRKAKAKTLSGGQKRKLQLGMMLTGGSAVCCIDEVSSGLDPLSRRKIWDILLAERGRRTIFLTTHFLDEADLLADHIAILSKGTLRAEGSSVMLKDHFGAGYRIHAHHSQPEAAPDVSGVEKSSSFDTTTYVAPSSSLAADVIRNLESRGITDYRFSGPTIEDVFLNLAEEVRMEETQGQVHSTDEKVVSKEDTSSASANGNGKKGLHLMSGKRLGVFKQTWILFLKRLTVLKSNFIPYLIALLLPIFAGGLVTLFIKGKEPVGCAFEDRGTAQGLESRFNDKDDLGFGIVVGPDDKFSVADAFTLIAPTIPTLLGPLLGGFANEDGEGNNGSGDPLAGLDLAAIRNNITVENSLDSMKQYISDHLKDVTPGGAWLGDNGDNPKPLLAYRADQFMTYSMIAQNFLDMLLMNRTIVTQYSPFVIPWAPITGESLQLVTYMCIALVLYPGFLALYPNMERLHLVRGLEYSNGVRPIPLWVAYTLFDWCIVLVSSAVVTILWVTMSDIWYHVGYMFLIFILYGLASILFGYICGCLAKGQLATFSWASGLQTVVFVGYIVGYMTTLSYAAVTEVERLFLIIHFTVAAICPIGSVIRALFVALNIFSTSCNGQELADNPGGIKLYGGPILYLILQSILYFIVILCIDSGSVASWFRRFLVKQRDPDGTSTANIDDEEIASEMMRVTSGHDPLKVMNITKQFRSLFKKPFTAVEDLTFGIKRGEVFALLGPNGAGKSTTVSLIRGDIQPMRRRGGDVLVENHSVIRDLASARSHLGVCPQFDAVDKMTVREHLAFYARVRGVSDVEHNVTAVLSAVGLQALQYRMAHTLSGGNKRKLSLGIALMGNPTVVLLDEPSSGLDPAAKRVMWATLQATVPGRSILLTTHSMEEADALAGRVGIMARTMLAMGTVEQLRGRFGNMLHVHLVSRSAPRTSDAETEQVRSWIMRRFPRAELDERTYHGQTRFAVPISSILEENATATEIGPADMDTSTSAVGRLVVILEEAREELGVDHFSVSPTTLDKVFLTIVGQHDVREENY